MVKKNFLKSSLIIAIAVAMMLPVIPTMSFAASKPIITYSAHMQTYGWDSTNKAPNSELTAKDAAKNYAGKIGESKRMEALEVNLSTLPGVTLKYRAHVQTYGWQDWVTADTTAGHTAIAGTTGESKRVEALQISVEGLKEQGYKLLYRAHVQTYGWLDWVDADDPNAFAGTSGESKRMEAFEIVVVPISEYTYEDNGNGTHSISYKGVLQGTAKCSYGEWTPTSTGATEYQQTCALCGHNSGEKTTLQDALTKAYTNGTKEVKAEKVTLSASNETLTVPAGVTLEVATELDVAANSKLVVDGNVVTKYLGTNMTSQNNNVKVSENGTFTVAGKYEITDTGDSDGILEDAANLPYVTNIIIEEDSVAQTLAAAAKIDKKANLTIDLNGTTVNGPASSYMFESSGNLTVNNGKFVNKTGEGIKVVEGSLKVTGGTMEVKDRAVALVGDTAKDIKERDLSKTPVTLNNVEIKATSDYAISALGNNGTVTLNNVNVDVTGTGTWALVTNGSTKNTSFKVTGGKYTSEYMVAYLPATGDNTFSNVTMTGKDGIEVAGGSLTVTGSTITATNASPTLAVAKADTGKTLNGSGDDICGAAILLKVKAGYGKDTEKFDLRITNSTVKSAQAAAVLVVEDTSANPISSVKTVNTSYAGSNIQGFTENKNLAEKDAIIYSLRTNSEVVVK